MGIRNDIRRKAFEELFNFLNWLAENYPDSYKQYMEEYSRDSEEK